MLRGSIQRATGLLHSVPVQFNHISRSTRLHRRPFAASFSTEIHKTSQKSNDVGFSKLLNPTQRILLETEKQLLHGLHTKLMELGTSDEELQVLRDAICQMDELFMVCIVGEFNAGKSSFVNALLGGRWVDEGVLPTTAKIYVLKHGAREIVPYVDSSGIKDEDILEVRLPVEWLSDVLIVDTPGMNAVVESGRHDRLTKRIVPRADLVIFVTSSDRPFSASERQFLTLIQSFGKKVAFVLNKIDMLPDEKSITEVASFVENQSAKILHHVPPVYPVSSRKALRAKLAAVPHGDPELGGGASQWEESRFGVVESALREGLSAEEKIQSKLLSPLGVASSLTENALDRIKKRRLVLATDLATVDLVEQNMAAFRVDVESDAAISRAHMGKALQGMVGRADDFFAANLRLSRLSFLMDSEEFKSQFEVEVLSGTGQQLDELIADMATLIEEKSRNQARSVIDFLGRRPGDKSQSIVGTIHDSQFDGARYKLLSQLKGSVTEVFGTFDKKKEAERITHEMRTSLYHAAALEASAVTVGGLLFLHLVPDVTGGIATASSLALFGGVMLPIRKRMQMRQFREKLGKMEKEMEEIMKDRLDRELHKISQRILESIAPYARFVRVEEEKTLSAQDALQQTLTEVRVLRGKIGGNIEK